MKDIHLSKFGVARALNNVWCCMGICMIGVFRMSNDGCNRARLQMAHFFEEFGKTINHEKRGCSKLASVKFCRSIVSPIGTVHIPLCRMIFAIPMRVECMMREFQ